MAEALPAQAQHEPKSESSPGLEARVSVSETTLSADIATLLVEDDSTTGQPKDEHDGQGSNDAASEYDDGSDKDDDKYRLESAPDRHRQISDKKRLDTAAFQSWMEKHQRDISKPDATQSDRHSVAHMIGNSWSNKIIASPREYQIDLFERAKAKNTIVVLDTGSGKTLISALLLRHVLDQELEDRAVGKSPKVAFFIVEKVALCFQQCAVLSANLEHPIAKFYGDAVILRTKEFWDKQLSQNMVIVCTAQILLDCLNGAFIQINQINLLIFDEAHHTKKNHPYARIIKNHYLREKDLSVRPRILGMTASPVDSQTRDVRAAAAELESLMCSEIATVSDEVLAAGQAQKNQVETIEYYWALIDSQVSRTELWTQISKQMEGLGYLRSELIFTQEASSTLGTWCADRYWKVFITNEEVQRLTARAGHDLGVFQGDKAAACIRQVQRIIQEHELGPISKRPADEALSFKTITLANILEDAFCDRGTKRCIVFVEKRYTAFLLADLFQQKGMAIPGMDSAYMVGSNPNGSSIANMSFRDQVLALQKFRRGDTNCLFATPVAEEGIDIPECDLIVRFDIYNSVIQYVQSKGRARQANSRYISMIEEGNMMDYRRLKQAGRDANALRQFCAALPADRKIPDVVIDAAAVAQYELSGQKTHEIPSTGARLTFSYSLEVLAKFVSSLSQGDTSARADFVTTAIGKRFTADVIFPDSSPIKFVSGYAQRSKQLARCSAAFEACVKLIKKKYINDHLQPVFAKKLPAMRNARLAVSSSKKSEYAMRITPGLWSRLGEGMPTKLFITTISLNRPDAVGHSTTPLILLTRESLPRLPAIPLFFGNGQGRSTPAQLLSSSQFIELTPQQTELLANFTLKVFCDVFSKEYEATADQMPYFLSPSIASPDVDVTPETLQIDWELLEAIKSQEYLTWEDQPDEFFHNKFVVDKFDGSRKLILRGINPGLKPADPTPADAPQPRSRSYRFVEQTIKEYSNSLWANARMRSVWKDDQPVVNADLLSLRRNLLDEFGDSDIDSPKRCYVILEPLMVSSIPTPFVFMALTLPAILHRMNSNLIALEACAILELNIRPDLALEALTKDSDNTEEHDVEQINFQEGMGNNYERLEFLGDSFLKMATTISLFTLIPESDEFEYHVERMLLIANLNLFNHAIDRGLQEYVRSKAFDRRTWYPDLKLRKGKAPKSEVRHCLADKSIADVCEALIGAAYLTSGEGDMDLAVKAVTKMVKSKNHKMTAFKEYHEAYRAPSWQSAEASAAQRFAVDRVAEAIGYKFRSPPLLRSTFKHPSYPYESSIPNYQRLEFLGDALLDMAIVDYLFKKFPAADPQWLTEHKMAMASNQFLGCLCVKLNLHKHLLVSTSVILGNVAHYVTELEVAEEAARREAENSNKEMRKDFWLQAVHPPKALPDIMEAIIGAMFVDSKYDYTVVLRFFDSFVRPYFEDMALYDSFARNHPVTALARQLHEDFDCTSWRICTSNVPCAVEEGVAVMTESDVVCALVVHEGVMAHATAKSGRYAKISAAKRALDRLRKMSREEYKGEFGCDCKGARGEMPDHGTAI